MENRLFVGSNPKMVKVRLTPEFIKAAPLDINGVAHVITLEVLSQQSDGSLWRSAKKIRGNDRSSFILSNIAQESGDATALGFEQSSLGKISAVFYEGSCERSNLRAVALYVIRSEALLTNENTNWYIRKLDDSWITTSSTGAANVKWPAAEFSNRNFYAGNVKDLSLIHI